MAPTVLWFRRDLRLADHPALVRAHGGGREILAVFVLDRALFDRAGKPRRAFLTGALADLRAQTGGRLAVLGGDPARVVPAVARQVRAREVHVSAEFTPYGAARDERVAAALADHAIAWVPTGSAYAVSPGRVRKPGGDPYRVFTPFYRAWREHGWRAPAGPAPDVHWLGYDGPHRRELPKAPVPPGVSLPVATEEAARRAWQGFRDGNLADYDLTRNRPDLDATSRLSPYLHLGLLHPRTLLADLGATEAGTTFGKQLCWREFYADVLHHNPASAWETYAASFHAFAWDADREAFGRWQRGDTGYPIVDAGMRQLLAEGWMHNRVRMITASFLVKDLHLPWQWGARHFLDHLVDGDIASNNHGWQWTAGTGTDAAPYFRVFNPVLQGKKFDPEGDYVRRWVPALRNVPGSAVHEPGKATALQALSPTYPAPMVDHVAERDEALRRYEQVRT